ncbi:phosphoesterase ykuE [Rhodopirellula sallentina SM41]|uniref:Phosphoesterase ykuE n=2 Tax=Rhodopirellula TaxID=265488 RepID=M5UKX8_9BACT|nr:phosphoesterase ykuE [Rhodopirellula sallentina SM41]
MDFENLMSCILVILTLIAHFGLRLTFYNRVNSLGWPRKRIKLVEKIAFVETWMTPLVIFAVFFPAVSEFAFTNGSWRELPAGLVIYSVLCLFLGGVFFALWLLWRPIFGVQHADVSRTSRCIAADANATQRYAQTRKCQWSSRVPCNQMFDLAIENVEVRLPGLPESLEGYRIAHLSDIHLTGHFTPNFMTDVIGHALDWQPELFALTGDIVDVQQCIGWLKQIFAPARASDGSLFILGNHDTRVSEPDEVRREMIEAGWTDVGGSALKHSLRQTDVLMVGNEAPWFGRPSDSDMTAIASDLPTDTLKICLSHSPDQYDWARRHEIDFMMCGHTHGGQGRLPLAGPILSPSWHGSRWASGDFYRAPTTMHVSRGLGGVHLLRINCRPELSLITLRRSN